METIKKFHDLFGKKKLVKIARISLEGANPDNKKENLENWLLNLKNKFSGVLIDTAKDEYDSQRATSTILTVIEDYRKITPWDKKIAVGVEIPRNQRADYVSSYLSQSYSRGAKFAQLRYKNIENMNEEDFLRIRTNCPDMIILGRIFIERKKSELKKRANIMGDKTDGLVIAGKEVTTEIIKSYRKIMKDKLIILEQESEIITESKLIDAIIIKKTLKSFTQP